MSSPRESAYYSSRSSSSRRSPPTDSATSPYSSGHATTSPYVQSSYDPAHRQYYSGSNNYSSWEGQHATPHNSPPSSGGAYYQDNPRYASAAAYESSRRLPPLSGGVSDQYRHEPSYASGLPSSQSHRGSSNPSYPGSYSQTPHSSGYSDYHHGGYNGLEGSSGHHSMTMMGPGHPPMPVPYGDQRHSSRYPGGHESTTTPPPVSPTSSSEDPPVKKKRKRADANQLKILTEVYNRTAFPSTEERIDLARRLDMTPRSVQIWFQNRRQSAKQMRQMTAQSAAATHQSLALSHAHGDERSSYGRAPEPSMGPGPSASHHHRRRSQEWGPSGY